MNARRLQQRASALGLAAALTISGPKRAAAQAAEGSAASVQTLPEQAPPPAPTPPSAATDAACVPACRAAFVCVAAQCVSACNPLCPSGQLCIEGGRCVSACDPACAAGQLCSDAGQCSAPQPAPAAVAAPAAQRPFDREPADPGWADGAAVFGYVSAAAIMAGTIAVMVNNDGTDEDTPRSIGIGTTLYAGVSVPIIAVGGGSARNQPAVRGAPALRVVSWIGYGLTLADAALLIAVSYDEAVSNPQILSVGLLGSLSALGFGLDAAMSAKDARRVEASRAGLATRAPWSLEPALGAARTPEGALVPTVGGLARF